MSIYGDAIRALRQVILLEERVRTATRDIQRLSNGTSDLRDRVSRLEGMLSGGVARLPPPRRQLSSRRAEED